MLAAGSLHRSHSPGNMDTVVDTALSCTTIRCVSPTQQQPPLGGLLVLGLGSCLGCCVGLGLLPWLVHSAAGLGAQQLATCRALQEVQGSSRAAG